MQQSTSKHAGTSEYIVAPIQADQCDHLLVEFVRLPDLQRLFGIKRSSAYNLIKSGAIKAVTLRKRGSRTGIKLISADSVRKYLHSLMEEK